MDFSNCPATNSVLKELFFFYASFGHGTKLTFSVTEQDSQICVYSLYADDNVMLREQNG